MFFTLFLFTIPTDANAAKIFIDLPEKPISVGNTSIIKVLLDTEQEINAGEGEIKFSSTKDIVALNTGGSIFSLWPKKPTLTGDKISFAGGNISGLYGKSLRLFTIAIKPTSQTPLKISFANSAVFLNDGVGTKVIATGEVIEIPVQISDVIENELAKIIKEDRTPPNKFKIELGRETTLYDEKYFISFFATDNDSGIERYEIIEGDRNPIRSESPYVLLDQNLSSLITVKAIDHAGNERVETFNSSENISLTKIIWLILFILVVLFTLYFFVLRKKR